MKKAIALEAICALIIILLLYASISKYMDFKKFVFDMHNQPFPHWLKDTLVTALPPVEIIISLMLVFPIKIRLVGLWAALILMTCFTAYTLLVLFHFFPRVPCSCGGIIKHLSWKQHSILNLFFTALAALGIYLYKRPNNSFSSQPASMAV